ncbi:MAG: LysR family transcriptional regulator [Hyphomicrobiaceae bacterium]|nr:MAG: LysR family transcriptional regulator [Hyphomicrobiaceae bacterium]
MNLATLDLNLLVALDALVSEAHVGRAALRIGLSQPATSHALRRLREIIGDPLLVRVGARMELTPRAQALRAPLAQALDQVRGLFVAERFDPAASQRRFVLMAPDLVVDLLVPPLVERIGARAPAVRLAVTPWRGPSGMTPEFIQSIDVIIACLGDAFPGFHRQRLYTDSDVLAVRRGHPEARRLKRLAGFLKARHIAVVGPGEREDMIDGWLRRQGIERHVALTVPGYLQALRMAARTDLVAFVPSRLVAALGAPLSLLALPPPIDPGIDEQFMFHPTRAHVDPGSVWLRNLIIDIARGLDRRKRQAA